MGLMTLSRILFHNVLLSPVKTVSSKEELMDPGRLYLSILFRVDWLMKEEIETRSRKMSMAVRLETNDGWYQSYLRSSAMSLSLCQSHSCPAAVSTQWSLFFFLPQVNGLPWKVCPLSG